MSDTLLRVEWTGIRWICPPAHEWSLELRKPVPKQWGGYVGEFRFDGRVIAVQVVGDDIQSGMKYARRVYALMAGGSIDRDDKTESVTLSKRQPGGSSRRSVPRKKREALLPAASVIPVESVTRCVVCGGEMVGKRSHVKTCSPKCRKALSRASVR